MKFKFSLLVLGAMSLLFPLQAFAGAVTASQTQVSLQLSQSAVLDLYAPLLASNNLFVQYNSNPQAVVAMVSGDSVNGSRLILYAQSAGNSTVTICQLETDNACAVVNVSVSGGSVLGATLYPNGSLLLENGTISQVYKGVKIGFTNMAAFTGLGYKLDNVMQVSGSNLPISGFVVQSPNMQHPAGTWVNVGQTVYFVHDNALIPIADYPTFLNNGGQPALIVPANKYDLQLSQEAIMTMNDSRLQ